MVWAKAVFGFVAAVVSGPMVTQGRNLNRGGEIMVWLMIMSIGWSVAAWPARKITGVLQRAVKRAAKEGEHRPVSSVGQGAGGSTFPDLRSHPNPAFTALS